MFGSIVLLAFGFFCLQLYSYLNCFRWKRYGNLPRDLSTSHFFSCGVILDVLCKKRDKNGILLGYVPHTYISIFDLLINIFTLFRSTLLSEYVCCCCCCCWYWTPFCMVFPNGEIMDFQPWKLTTPDLGSVSYFYAA